MEMTCSLNKQFQNRYFIPPNTLKFLYVGLLYTYIHTCDYILLFFLTARTRLMFR